MATDRARSGVPALVVAVLLAAAAGSGCEDSPTNSLPASDEGSARSRCESSLKTALDMTRPGRLGVSADRETAAGMLNEWLVNCAEDQDPQREPEPAVRKLLETVLSAGELKRLTAERFIPREADHVRNCLLYKAIVENVSSRVRSPVGRAVALFNFVVRNVELVGDREKPLSLTPYEVLVIGRGTAEDQAWVFANLLRQLRVDTVILQPAGPSSEQKPVQRYWVVGVLLDGQVYLFDPRLGSAIPAGGEPVDSPLVAEPAVLSELLADDAPLKRLGAGRGHAYPLTSESLKAVRVAVIGNSGFWSASMQTLQRSLSGEDSAVVFDPLGDRGERPGLVSRIAGFGNRWDASDVDVWKHPSQRLKGFEAAKDSDEFERLESLLSAPLRKKHQVAFRGAQKRESKQYVVDPGSGEIVFEGPTYGQLKARLRQLRGEYATATSELQKFRMDSNFENQLPVNPAIRTFHARAAMDAFYWLGLCQLDQGDWESAEATLSDYLERYSEYTSAARVRHCRSMLALCRAQSGRTAAAVATLKEADADGPLRLRHAFWARRWSELQQADRK